MAPLAGFSVTTLVTTTIVSRPPVSETSGAFERAEVDGRTGLQWLKAAIAHCDCHAGTAWRRLSDPRQRYAPERLFWLEVIRLLTDVLLADPQEIRLHSASPLLHPIRHELSGEPEYRTWRRDSLARALVNENSKFTDAKLLSHLPKPKLARMLAETRLAARNARRAHA